MANDFDRILKENIEPALLGLARRLLNIDITGAEILKDKMQVTLEREADFIIKITAPELPTDSKKKKPPKVKSEIIHFEFQANLPRKIRPRMLLYRALLTHKYDCPIRQYVIYIGTEDVSNFQTSIVEDKLNFDFTLIALISYDYTLFLEANTPEEVILAILGNHKNEKPEAVIEKIINRLRELTGDDIAFGKFSRQLEILSDLRKLQAKVSQNLEKMSYAYNYKEDRYFKRGIEEGVEIGVEKGIEKGIDLKTEYLIIFHLTKELWTIEQIADNIQVSIEEVRRVKKKWQAEQAKKN